MNSNIPDKPLKKTAVSVYWLHW